jgi:murein DD-endopeptidase MepM/ murein hydrolase activator NlpD
LKKPQSLLLAFFIFLFISFSLYEPFINLFNNQTEPAPEVASVKSINNTIENGETLFSIFTKYGLRTEELFEMKSAAASIHPLRHIRPGQSYTFILDEQNCISAFTYGINEDTFLKIERVDGCFQASKYSLPYETRVLTIGGSIQENLVSAFGTEREDYLLALQAADILAWDIDFNTDLRSGDTFRIIVEGLYLDGEFKKYGKILSIEFINEKQTYNAHLFDYDGKSGYYNAEGQSLRRAFLKAPLSFRRISSHFSKSRMHPILKVRRPHHGIDYVAAAGTPVSTVADGTVTFAGYRGAYGNLVIIAHRNNYQTYYGHLSRFAGGIRTGKKVRQGDLVGYVGATGLATGPHLHYEMRQNAAPINPQRIKNVAGDPIPAGQMAEFRKLANSMNKIYDVAVFYDTRNEERKNHYLQPAVLAALTAYTRQKDTPFKNN